MSEIYGKYGEAHLFFDTRYYEGGQVMNSIKQKW